VAENDIMNLPILISSQDVRKTLSELQKVGQSGAECVVLWLGKRTADGISVETVWKPEQQSGRDFFTIPETAMEKLFGELRSGRMMIAAQVHTHPRLAFHSQADDEWAIVRHTGALSLVVPHFALRTQPESFKKDTAVFTLSSQNEWRAIPEQQKGDFYQIV
jgi:hypothetical protein